MPRPASIAHLDLLGLVLRPIGRDDREAVSAAFERLSPTSRYRRFHSPKPRLTSAELTFLTDLDPTRHRAVGAFRRGDGQLIGVARYVRFADAPESADLAIAVIDEWHRRGVGRALVGELIGVAARDRIARLRGMTLAENAAARGLLRVLGFRVTGHDGDTIDYALEPAAPLARPALPAAA